MIEYAEEYYIGGEMEGFYVTGMMKRSWAASLEVLIELDRICKKHDIKYFLMYGSLLGAIRHEGFIPWDDDIDVGMLREDYNRFIAVAADEISEPFIIGNAASDSLLYPCRMVNAESPCVEEWFLKRFHGCPYISGIDIFSLDNVTDDEKSLTEFQEIYKIVKYASQRLDPLWDENKLPLQDNSGLEHPDADDLDEVVAGIEEYFGIEIPSDDSRYEFLAHMADKLAQTFSDEACSYVAYINQIDINSQKINFMPKAAFNDTVGVKFQGLDFPAPKGYETVLEALYGTDWRIPKRGGAAHLYPAYSLQAQILENIYEESNVTPPDYFFL